MLNLKIMAYLSSAGVRTIVKVASLSKTVNEVLENVGVAQLVKTFSSVDEAVASF